MWMYHTALPWLTFHCVLENIFPECLNLVTLNEYMLNGYSAVLCEIIRENNIKVSSQHAKMIDSAHILAAILTSGYTQINPSKSNLMKQDPTNSWGIYYWYVILWMLPASLWYSFGTSNNEFISYWIQIVPFKPSFNLITVKWHYRSWMVNLNLENLC